MSQEPIVNLSNFKIKENLGKDMFDDPYLIEEIKSGEKFIAKTPIKNFKNKKDKIELTQKLASYSKFDDPSILPLYGYSLADFNGNPNPTIITKYMENQSVKEYIKNAHCFPSSRKYLMIFGIAKGMEFLHSHQIIHRNLKPENILLDHLYLPHISDFYTSKISNSINSIESDINILSYMAPEILTKKVITPKVDVYSFAIISYEIITESAPFPEIQNFVQLKNYLSQNKRPDLSKIDSERLRNLLSKCWSANPDDRPEFKDIVHTMREDKFWIEGNVDFFQACCYFPLFGDHGSDDAKTFYFYGYYLDKKDESEKLKNEALIFYKMAANEGYVDAFYRLGKMYCEGDGVECDKGEASRYFKVSADKGHMLSMYKYALLLDEGDGIECDKKEAAKYYKMAADGGYIESMFNYAILLDEGDGIERDKKEAAKYYKMAADGGYIDSMFMIALMLSNGDGVVVDKKEAARYFKMAADGGSILAMVNYADMLFNGDGINADKKEAARYYKLAADNGNEEAMFAYAKMLDEGDGIEANKKEARRYFHEAADNGYEDAIQKCQDFILQENRM